MFIIIKYIHQKQWKKIHFYMYIICVTFYVFLYLKELKNTSKNSGIYYIKK